MVGEINRMNFHNEVTMCDKLVLVDIYATWCGPCKALAPILEELATKFVDKIKVVKLNIDEEESMAASFGIMSVPTALMFKYGEKVGSFVGLRSLAEIEKMIEKLL